MCIQISPPLGASLPPCPTPPLEVITEHRVSSLSSAAASCYLVGRTERLASTYQYIHNHAHDIQRALHSCYYYISSSSDLQALDPGDGGPLPCGISEYFHYFNMAFWQGTNQYIDFCSSHLKCIRIQRLRMYIAFFVTVKNNCVTFHGQDTHHRDQ